MAPIGQAANPSAQQAFIQTPARAPTRNATITPELGSAADYSYEPDMLLQRRSPATTLGVLGLIGAALVGLFVVLQSGDADVELPEATDEVVVSEAEAEAEAEAESSQAEATEATQAASEGEEAAGTEGGGQADSSAGTKVDPATSESGNSAVENAGSTKKSSASRGSTSRGSSTKKKKKKTKKSGPSKAEKADSRDSGRVIHELMMLRAAKQSLGSNPAQALAYTSQHASEFPHSQLKEQRYEIRIRALCKLGRKTQAKNEVDKIMERKKSSKARSHYSRYCG